MKQRQELVGGGKKIESRETQEVFRATFGFDFIFYLDEKGVKRCACVEINGEESGIGGVADIPKGEISEMERLFAQIRDRRSEEHHRKVMLADEIFDDMKDERFPASPEAKKKIAEFLWRSVKSTPFLPNAFRNPKDIEEMTENKVAQQHFIPEQYRPRAYEEDGSVESRSGYWICKPSRRRGGQGVRILTTEQVHEYYKDMTAAGYVIQEFLEPLGADRAPEEKKGNPASMRLIIDFRYMADGTVDVAFKYAYQRVSPNAPDDLLKRGWQLSLEDIYVVNKYSGASSAASSDEEQRLAEEAAFMIIENVARAYIQERETEDAEEEPPNES